MKQLLNALDGFSFSRRTPAVCALSAVTVWFGMVPGVVGAETLALKLRVDAGPHDRQDTPVVVPLELPDWGEQAAASLQREDGEPLSAQLTAPAMHFYTEAAEGMVWRELHFVLDELAAGDALELQLTITSADGAASSVERGFAWQDEPGEHMDLVMSNKGSGAGAARPVLRYMYEALDDSSPARREQTYKVYHHVFAPDGSQLISKGPGGKYTHHRGLFYGFNKVTYGDGRAADVWHCRGKAYQSHDGFLEGESGAVLGRHRLAIGWHGQEGEVFAHERRELTAYNISSGLLVEFASHLVTAGGTVKLDGDPQHAGFHFRASNEVASSTEAQTYYLRPDGRDEPGDTRNWPDNADHVNLAWNAMSFVVGGQRYTAAYLDRPENPKEARFSERAYGRFGSYFEYEVSEGQPLDVRYRVWFIEGEATAAQIERRHLDFVEPVRVTVQSS